MYCYCIRVQSSTTTCLAHARKLRTSSIVGSKGSAGTSGCSQCLSSVQGDVGFRRKQEPNLLHRYPKDTTGGNEDTPVSARSKDTPYFKVPGMSATELSMSSDFELQIAVFIETWPRILLLRKTMSPRGLLRPKEYRSASVPTDTEDREQGSHSHRSWPGSPAPS